MVEDVTAHPTSPVAQKIGDATPRGWTRPGSRRAASRRLKPYLARIDAISNRTQLVHLMAEPSYAAPIYLGIDRRPG